MTNEEALDLLEHGDWFQSVYNSLPESTANKVAEAIEAVAKAVHSATTSEPLTLEQLREMVDEPVYLYIYDTALDSGWHIIKTVTEEKLYSEDGTRYTCLFLLLVNASIFMPTLPPTSPARSGNRANGAEVSEKHLITGCVHLKMMMDTR